MFTVPSINRFRISKLIFTTKLPSDRTYLNSAIYSACITKAVWCILYISAFVIFLGQIKLEITTLQYAFNFLIWLLFHLSYRSCGTWTHNIFDLSSTGIVVSNFTRGMVICSRLCCVCYVLCWYGPIPHPRSAMKCPMDSYFQNFFRNWRRPQS